MWPGARQALSVEAKPAIQKNFQSVKYAFVMKSSATSRHVLDSFLDVAKVPRRHKLSATCMWRVIDRGSACSTSSFVVHVLYYTKSLALVEKMSN